MERQRPRLILRTPWSIGNQNSPTTFNLFQCLPTELRLMIWNYLLPGPRVVYLERRDAFSIVSYRVWSDVDVTDDNQLEDFCRDDLDYCSHERLVSHCPLASDIIPDFGFSSPSNKPLFPMLHACQESRSIAMKRYEKVFPTTYQPAEVWFNFEEDTLYVDWGGTEQDRVRKFEPFDFIGLDAARVQHLALFDGHSVNDYLRNGGIDYSHWLHNWVLPVFKNLKNLTIVDQQHGIERDNYTDLAIMDEVVDIDAALKCYNADDVSTMHPRKADEVDMRSRIQSHKVRLNALFKPDFLQHWLKSTGAPRRYNFPEVYDQRTITARKRFNEYEESRRKFLALKEDYYVDLEIRAVGYMGLCLRVGAETTLWQAADIFRAKRHIPHQLSVLDVRTWDFHLEDPRITAYDLQLPRAATLRVDVDIGKRDEDKLIEILGSPN